ncbi:hypothetical protein C8J57DRAFT_1532126 [Mycena rebaudengoi]|nr:hypothetical protein C8J57DRAFT_1532126 [Mycena rebaudengoi]
MSVQRQPKPEPFKSVHKDHVLQVVPPPIEIVDPADKLKDDWTFWVESWNPMPTYEQEHPLVFMKCLTFPDMHVLFQHKRFNRKNRCVLFFIRIPTTPGVIASEWFAAAVPETQFWYMSGSNGKMCKAEPSQFMYLTKDPDAADINKKAPTPLPEELPTWQFIADQLHITAPGPESDDDSQAPKSPASHESDNMPDLEFVKQIFKPSVINLTHEATPPLDPKNIHHRSPDSHYEARPPPPAIPPQSAQFYFPQMGPPLHFGVDTLPPPPPPPRSHMPSHWCWRPCPFCQLWVWA